MIKEMRIKGFKCFDDITLQLKNITLLVGQNSIGKSTVIHAILSTKQKSEINPFAGKYINIGKINELYNEYTGASEIVIEAETDSGESARVSVKGLSERKIEFKELKTQVVYCSAERIGVQDVYEKSISGGDEIGSRCEYAFAYLAQHGMDELKENLETYVYSEDTQHTFGGQVDYWLNNILGYMVRAEEIEQTELVRVSYRNSRVRSGLRPKNVGTGVTYIAEVIIAALSCKPNDILIIENPEIHLHPSGQAKFVEFLSFISTLGIQVILETHSDHIYNGIRRCVHQDLLMPQELSIYFFKSNEKGCSEPVLVKVNEEGKAKSEDGMFDQIKKDLDVILGW